MDLLSLEGSEDTIPEIISVEEMTLEEARASLQTRPHHGTNNVQRLKARHHQVAKLVAAGFRSVDIARKTGYAPGTVNALRSAPAVKELIEHYSDEYDESVSELHDRMEHAVIELMDLLQDKLEDDDEREDISINELRTLMMDLLDRVGRGPVKRIEKHSRNENFNVGIIKRVREVASEKRYDAGRAGRDQAQPLAGLPMPQDRRLGMGKVEILQSLAKVPETVRVDCEGLDL